MLATGDSRRNQWLLTQWPPTPNWCETEMLGCQICWELDSDESQSLEAGNTDSSTHLKLPVWRSSEKRANLRWDAFPVTHPTTSKHIYLTLASKLFYYFTRDHVRPGPLKRVGVPHAQLHHFYISVIRPVLEYAVPVWHHLLIKTQTDNIESVQKRVLRIIYSFSNDITYCNSLDVADIASLSTQNEHSRKFFSFHSSPFLLSSLPTPSPWDPNLLARLRAPTKIPLHTHTN